MTPGQNIVAITGASGFIGRHLCAHFAALGWEVRAFVRNPAAAPPAPGVKQFLCDLPDQLDLAGLQGARALVHCAYMTRFTDLEAARRVNDEGTRKVLAACERAGVPARVFLSSQSAHETAESYYGRSKLALEELFRGPEDVVIRSGLVLGASGEGLFHRMRDMVRSSRVIPLFGGGHQPIQTIHVEDLCRAIAAAVTRGLTGLFTVAEPRALEMGQLLREIASRLGKRPLFVPFPMSPALLVLRVIEGLRIPFPVSSENLIGLKCLRASDTSSDLARLGVEARDHRRSLDEIIGPGPARS